MNSMYIYAYYDGVKIPDVTAVEYNGDKVDVVIQTLPDKFPYWFSSLPHEGRLELRMDNVGIDVKTFDKARYCVAGATSVVDEITEITLRFYASNK